MVWFPPGPLSSGLRARHATANPARLASTPCFATFCGLKVPLQRQHGPELANRIRHFTG